MSKESDFVKAYKNSDQKKASNQANRPQSRKKNIGGSADSSSLQRRGEGRGIPWYEKNRNSAKTGSPEPDMYGNFHDIPKVVTTYGQRGSPRKGGKKGQSK